MRYYNSMIKVINLWKSFPTKRDRPGFKEFIVNVPNFIRKKKDCFWALKNINLKVEEGECLGVIGKNGAGKSTLLSLLLGVAHPTNGKIETNAKITPLLELGAGFHSDLTGIENIIMNGVLLGLTEAEVRNKMNDIIDFSELENFINKPLRTYSSGMTMRLAFSIAIYSNPEIFLIDEILAVGDESFQKKSGNELINLIKGGCTTVFVSHSMEAVKRMCDRVIWLEQGEIREEGEPGRIIDSYLRI